MLRDTEFCQSVLYRGTTACYLKLIWSSAHHHFWVERQNCCGARALFWVYERRPRFFVQKAVFVFFLIQLLITFFLEVCVEDRRTPHCAARGPSLFQNLPRGWQVLVSELWQGWQVVAGLFNCLSFSNSSKASSGQSFKGAPPRPRGRGGDGVRPNWQKLPAAEKWFLDFFWWLHQSNNPPLVRNC